MSEAVPTAGRTWVQIALLLGEAALMVLSGAALFVVISRISGPSLLGNYALVLAWWGIFHAIGQFGIPEFLIRELGRDEANAGRILFNAMAIAVLGLSTAAMLLALPAGLYGYDAELTTALRITALSLVPGGLTGVCRAGLIVRQRSDRILLIRLVEFIAIVPTSAVSLLSGGGIVELVAISLVGRTLGCIVALMQLYGFGVRPRRQLDLAAWSVMLPTMLVFGSGALLGLLTRHLNTLMIPIWQSIDTVGQYGAAAKLIEVMALLPVVFVQSSLAGFSRAALAEEGDWLRAFDGSFRALFALVGVVAVGLGAFADQIVWIVYGEGFEPAVWVLRIFSIYLLLYAADVGTSLILKAARMQALDLRIYCLNPITAFCLNLFLIPRWGAAGAAASIAIATALSLSLRYATVLRLVCAPRWASMMLAPLAFGIPVAFGLRAVVGSGPGWLPMVSYGALALLAVAARLGVLGSAVRVILRGPERGR